MKDILHIKPILILVIISLSSTLRGAKIIAAFQINHAAIVTAQELDLSLSRVFSTDKELPLLPQHGSIRIYYENSQWAASYYPCVIAIKNADSHYLEFCSHIPYLGLGLLRVVNQEHTNQVSKQRELPPDEVARIREEGTRLALVALKLLQMEKPQGFVWVEVGRILQRIVLLLNQKLSPYLVAVRKQAILNQPFDPVYQRELGEAMLLDELPVEAIEQLNAAVAYNPRDDKTYHLLALAYYQLGDLEKAEQYARVALSLNPDTEHAYYRRLGEICEAKKNIVCAIESYEKLLSLKADDAFAIARLEILQAGNRP